MAFKEEQQFTTQPPALATFSFEDIASGIGFIRFYAMNTSLTAGTEYILGTNVQYSNDEYRLLTTVGTAVLTFRSPPFNNSRFIKGTAVFSCAIHVNASASSNVSVKLQEWDGSSATDLTETIESIVVTSGGLFQKNILLQLPITTEKNIEVGKQLQIVVTFESTTNNNTKLAHDPAGRQTDFTGSQEVNTAMTIDVPFRNDIL